MSVASKNLYELLGNTSDQDSDREPEPPTKAIEKPAPRSGKRDAPKAAPTEAVSNNTASRGRGGDRRGGFSGSEAAFRDRATGRNRNRDQPAGEAEDGVRPGRDRGPGTRSIGRGPRGPRRGGDRHSRTGVGEHQKQADHGWGNQTGEGEWADEKAGDAMATQEVKEDGWDAGKPETFNANAEPTTAAEEGGQAAPEAEAEPEDTSKSYTEYLAEQAAKKLEGLGLKEARQPNEGAKENKKWKSAKELTKADEEEAYFKGEEKARRDRERTRNAKEFLDIDYSFKEQSRDTRGGARGGGRGRGRGDRPERGDRADRGDRGERSDRGDRSEYRGGRGRGDFSGRGRGENRGGRGRGRGDTPAVAIDDNSAFPSLGGK